MASAAAGALGVEHATVPKRRAPTSSDSPTMPLHGDHHRGEDGVAGQRGGLVAAGDHQRDDQRDLDDGDGDGEHERAERLPHPVGDDLGVVHRGQHRAGEQQRDDARRRRCRCRAPRWRPARPARRRAGPATPGSWCGEVAAMLSPRRRPATRRATRSAASTTLESSIARVIGPTPPGLGLTKPATSQTSGATSPATTDLPVARRRARRRRRARPRRA